MKRMMTKKTSNFDEPGKRRKKKALPFQHAKYTLSVESSKSRGNSRSRSKPRGDNSDLMKPKEMPKRVRMKRVDFTVPQASHNKDINTRAKETMERVQNIATDLMPSVGPNGESFKGSSP